MSKKYVFAAVATIAVGVAVGAAQFSAQPAVAQQTGPLDAQCRTRDANGQVVFWHGNGDTVLFVARGDALMRDRGGPRTSYAPEWRNKVASVELKPGCRAVLYGQFGATWGHRAVNATGPVGVPSNHIGGMKCECP